MDMGSTRLQEDLYLSEVVLKERIREEVNRELTARATRKVIGSMVSLFCTKCKKSTLHFYHRMSQMWECDECGTEHEEKAS